MKILAFSDVHLDSVNDPSSPKEVLLVETGEWLADMIAEHRPDMVVNLGDTNHRDGGMSTGTIALFRRFFDPILMECRHKGIQIYNIVGNHDQYTRNGELHVMEPLGWHEEAVVLNYPHTYSDGEIDILFAPYRRDPEQYFEEIKESCGDSRKWDLVFTHMDIKDLRMNSGLKSGHGIDANAWEGDVFNGHYHMPQKLGNVTVVGAPQYTQFRDIDPPGTPRRGAMVIEKKKGEPAKVTRLRNPHTQHYGKFTGVTADELIDQYFTWRSIVTTSNNVPREHMHVWFVGPQVALSELQADISDELYLSELGTCRMTPNDKVKSEETTITLDVSPQKAIEQYAAEFKCTCGEDHDTALGKSILQEAEAYTVAKRTRKPVEFLTLSIENFMSIGSAGIVLDGQDLTLIEGINVDDPTVESNGSGKSAIAEALLWCLFDQTARGIGKDEIIRRGQKKAMVTVAFRIGGVRYSVTRTRTKGKGICEIYREDANVTPHDQRSATSLIESYLGVNFDQFLLMVVMAQGFNTKFSSFGDSERKELLESFLGIEIYDQARQLVADQLRELKHQRSTAETNIVKAEQAILTASENKKLAEVSLSSAQAEDIAAWSALEQKISEMSRYVADCEVLHKEQKAHVDISQTRVTTAAKVHFEREQHVARLKFELGNLQSALDGLQERFKTADKPCPTCGSPMSPERILEVCAQIEAEGARVFEQIEAKKVELRAEGFALEGSAEALQKARETFEEQNAHLQVLTSQLGEHRGHLLALTKQHKDMTPKAQAYQELIAKLGEQIEESKRALEQQKVSKISVDTTIHSYDYWMSAFDPTGIRSVLLRTVVNYVNEYLHEMCGIVMGGSYLVQLSSTKELKTKKEAVNKLDIVVTPDGSYKAGSGGERRKIDLLLNLAVARLAKQTCGFSPNIIFADEVLDNLDLTASQHVLQMFDAEVKKGTSVFLISHNPSVKPLIPNVITVVKKNGESEVVKG